MSSSSSAGEVNGGSFPSSQQQQQQPPPPHPRLQPTSRRGSLTGLPSSPPSSSSATSLEPPVPSQPRLLTPTPSQGSPMQRNTTVPTGVVRLHKTLSLGGEKKPAVALPVVPITAVPAVPAADPLRRFPPPSALLASALSSAPSPPSSTTTTTPSRSSTREDLPPLTDLSSTTTTTSTTSTTAKPTALHPKNKPRHSDDLRRLSSGKSAAEEKEHNGVSAGSTARVLTFPSLGEMADSEAGRASLSLCSDGTPSIHFRRRFLSSEIGDSLYSILVSRAAWKNDTEHTGPHGPKFAWFGDAQTELSCADFIIKHDDWSKVPLLQDIKEKLELEFHASFNAVQCSFFRSGLDCCNSFPEDALSKDTDAVFICLGQKRYLLLSPKARSTQHDTTMSKLPHVRVVMEINAAIFVHRAARSHYDYSVPSNEDSSLGGNILLCFRRLNATKKKSPVPESSAREMDRTRADQTVIYIDEADELQDLRRLRGDGSNRDARPVDALKDFVGRIFYSKVDLARLGIHKSYTSPICGNMENGADSILLSDSEAPSVDERLSYTCMINSHENQVERAILQVNVLNDTPVRLVRAWRADFKNDNARVMANDNLEERMWYRYDGLYSVRYGEKLLQHTESKGLSGRKDAPVFCEFLLTRLPIYPPPPQPVPRKDITKGKPKPKPKPQLPSISSLTSLPHQTDASFRERRSLSRSDTAIPKRDSPADDDGVEIIEVKTAQQASHPTLPPTSTLLKPSLSAQSMTRRPANSPPHTSVSPYPPLLPMSSPSRQAPTGSVPLPGILPYMKGSQQPYTAPQQSKVAPKASTTPPAQTAVLSASTSSAVPTTSPYPVLSTSAALPIATTNPPSPPSSNNLNQAMLMYSLFGASPMQAAGATLHGTAVGHPQSHQRLDTNAASRRNLPPSPSKQPPNKDDVAREQHIARQPALSPLVPALYDVPTAQLLFFMNLIPQKDREIAHIMQQREFKASKRKRKEEQQERKRKRKREGATQTSASTRIGGSGSKPSSKPNKMTIVEIEPDLAIDYGVEDEVTTKTGSRRKRSMPKKTAAVDVHRAKETAERSHAPKRKRNSDQPPKPDLPISEDKLATTASNRRGRGDRTRKRSTSPEAEGEGSLFCICRSPDEYGFMIACDKCNDWFHGGCVGLTPEEGQDLKTYICPRCQPPNPRKKHLPFGDALSFSSENGRSRGAHSSSLEEPSQILDEGKVEWKMLGEVVYCGDGDLEEDFESEDPRGFIFIAYESFDDIATEREEARKTREEYIKKQEQQKYLQKRLQEAMKGDHHQPQQLMDTTEQHHSPPALATAL